MSLSCKIIKYLSINFGCNGGVFADTTMTAISMLAAILWLLPAFGLFLVLSFLVLDNTFFLAIKLFI